MKRLPSPSSGRSQRSTEGPLESQVRLTGRCSASSRPTRERTRASRRLASRCSGPVGGPRSPTGPASRRASSRPSGSMLRHTHSRAPSRSTRQLSLASGSFAEAPGGSGSLGPPTPSSSSVVGRRSGPRRRRARLPSRRGGRPRRSFCDSNLLGRAVTAPPPPSDTVSSTMSSSALRVEGPNASRALRSSMPRWKVVAN